MSTPPSPAPAADDRVVERLGRVVSGLAAARRERARLAAAEARLLAQARALAVEWGDADPALRHTSHTDLAHRAVHAEVATVLRESDRVVAGLVDRADALVMRFLGTMASLEAGTISEAHARVIVEAGARIVRPELVSAFEDAVLPYAEQETAARLRPLAQRRAEWFLEETLAERHARARSTRRVWVRELGDGMAEVGACVEAALAHGVFTRLTAMARMEQTHERATISAEGGHKAFTPDPLEPDAPRAESYGARGSEAPASDAPPHALPKAPAPAVAATPARVRSLDELRADMFADLLLASDPTAAAHPTGLAGIRAEVTVTVPVLSLIGGGAADGHDVAEPFDSATLAGRVPIAPTIARRLAGTATGWDRVLTHPIAGTVLTVDRYRPSEDLRRHLRARDVHCRFPGCRMPLRACDIDHTVDWQHDGPTEAGNLAHLCRRHHTMKHHTRWRVKQTTHGVLHWTSPTGRHHTDIPASTVAFAVDEESDPLPF